jgi:hypothetical protein
MAEYLVWIVATLMVMVSVSIHYEVMNFISDKMVPWAQKHLHNRRVIAIAIMGLLAGHIAEIWLFALAMKILVSYPDLGSIQGDFTGKWGDFLYLSAVDYTSLGENNVRLAGPLRALVVSETLTGMMLIAWSASFAYLKMEQLWKQKNRA